MESDRKSVGMNSEGGWLEVSHDQLSDVDDAESASEIDDTDDAPRSDTDEDDSDFCNSDGGLVRVRELPADITDGDTNSQGEIGDIEEENTDIQKADNYFHQNVENSVCSDDENFMDVGHMYVYILGQPRMGKTSLCKTLIKAFTSGNRGWKQDATEGSEDTQEVENPVVDANDIVLKHENSSSRIIFVHSNVDNSEDQDEIENSRNRNTLNVCIYALPPHQITPLDEASLFKIAEQGKFDVVLPVVCKAETMTLSERGNYLDELETFCAKHEGLDCLITSDIVAVVCEERNYSWGSVSPFDAKVSQIEKLCDNLETHIQFKNVITSNDNMYLEGSSVSSQISQFFNLGDCCKEADCAFCSKTVSAISHLTTINIQRQYMMMLSGALALLILQLLYSGKTYVLVLVSEVGLGASLVIAMKNPACQKTKLASTTVSLCFASTLLYHYINDHSAVDSVDAVEYNCDVDTQVESFNATVEVFHISTQLENALIDVTRCEQTLANWATSCALTNKRLDKALELCGSWCAGV